jgi:hypothetical protein
VAANWNPNQVPASADNAYITNNGDYMVTLNASATVASLALGGSTGTQTFVQNANTLTLNGPSTFGSNGAFSLGGGTLGGAGSLVVNGPFTWRGGTIENTGGVTLNGTSSLDGVGTSAMALNGGLLINAGALTWSGSGQNLYFYNGTLTNLAAGTITITADVSNSAGYGTLGNAGLLTKTATTGTSILSMAVVNTGTIAVQSGTISLTGSYTLTGGTLNFGINGLTNYGQINLAGSAALTGTVSANLNNGYIPTATNVFTVLTYGSKSGIFGNTVLPFTDAWQTNYTATNFSLTALNARPIIFTGTIPVKELTTLTTNVVSDLDIPAQTLTSSLVSAPNGMSINAMTGVITWTPAQTNSPSTNTVTVIATDDGTPPLRATNSLTVLHRVCHGQ